MKSFVKKMIVEIPRGSSNKYEYDILNNRLILDRVLFGANFYPGEYGFIPKTLDWDGDPLDVISLSTYPTVPGCEVAVRILGMIEMIDDGEIDSKLFGVIDHDPRFNHIQALENFPPHILNEFLDFFRNYKNLQNKEIKIKGVKDIKVAKKELETCQMLYQKYNHILETKGKKELMKILNKKQAEHYQQ